MRFPNLEPPLVDLVFWGHGRPTPKLLSDLVSTAEAHGAVRTGLVKEWKEGPLPPFSLASDLAGNTIATRSDTIHAGTLAVALEHPRHGPAIVHVASVHPPTRHPVHPVSLTVSGDLLWVPTGARLSREERARGRRLGMWLLRVLRAACDTHPVLAAAVLYEETAPNLAAQSFPPPRSTEWFFADEVWRFAPGPARALEDAYPPERLMRWNRGTWCALADPAPDAEPPSDPGPATQAVARLLREGVSPLLRRPH